MLPARDAARNELRHWWPGRVIEASADEVITVLADRQSRLAQQAIFTGEEWRAFANQPAEDARGFFELGEYERGARVVRWVAAEESSLLDDLYDDLVSDLRS